jgi:phosphatidylinositol glycan class Z
MSTSKEKVKKMDDIPPIERKRLASRLKLKSYWILIVIRFGLVFMPQNGYIHPDEFFQSVEVLTGKKQ